MRRTVWLGTVMLVIGLVATEGVAWVAAERFRGALDRLDGSTVVEAKDDYEGILRLSLLDAGVHLRVDDPLRERLVSFADSIIADYRREEPVMGPAEWRQAQEAMRWAVRLSPRNRRLLARQALCEAHVLRLAARGQAPSVARYTYRRAAEKFRAAAGLDDESFDPYVAISLLEVYGAGDVDEAAAAIQEAEKRGYVPGRREQALLGDGYLRRATSTRALARSLSGEQRRRELEKARDDYRRCVAAFDPIVGFGRSAANLESCKRQVQRIDQELAQMDVEASWKF
jgi:hypothetical protein